jgi:hypothetical protein
VKQPPGSPPPWSPSSWAPLLRDWLTATWRLVVGLVPVIVLAILVLVVLVITGAIDWHLHASSPGKPKADEYAYLDSARVASYLGQVSGGDVQSENREEISKQDSGFALELSNVGKATSSRGSQVTRNVVVSQTQADKFAELLSGLESEPTFTKLDASRCDFGKQLASPAITAGTTVLIKNAFVRMPPYLSMYPELRYGLYRLRTQHAFGAAPLTSFQEVDESVRGTSRLEREHFKKEVGKNPRIPFSITVPYTSKEVSACKSTLEARDHREVRKGALEVTVFLPARFARLTGEPSLLSRRLTIVGKVVSNGVGTFGDGLTVSTYWRALSEAQAPLLRELGVSKTLLAEPRLRVRRALFAAMERSVTFQGHVVEVIPIAMYD